MPELLRHLSQLPHNDYVVAGHKLDPDPSGQSVSFHSYDVNRVNKKVTGAVHRLKLLQQSMSSICCLKSR